jgi:hypothetical protein
MATAYESATFGPRRAAIGATFTVKVDEETDDAQPMRDDASFEPLGIVDTVIDASGVGCP